MRPIGQKVLLVRRQAPAHPQALQGLPGQISGVQDEERADGTLGNEQTRLCRIQLLGN